MKKGLFIIVLLLGAGAFWAWQKYKGVFEANVDTGGEPYELFISNEDEYSDVEQALLESGILLDADAFIWTAKQKGYPELVKSGRYLIEDGLSSNALVDMLRAGRQTPVKVTFNNVRNLPRLAGKVSNYIEADSLSLLKTLMNDSIISHYGFSKDNFISMFIPDSYEMYWTDSPHRFIERMASAFKGYWNQQRVKKANQRGLSQSQVVTLASIVQAEQATMKSEWPTIAGLYLNRLERGIPLQSDPTVIFAVGDFSMRRVLTRDTRIDSPYNTYKYPGLPPGPIRMPDKAAVDAVLDAPKHDYIFMCAHADLSGKHHFSKTLREHNRHAAAYRQALNSRGVYR